MKKALILSDRSDTDPFLRGRAIPTRYCTRCLPRTVSLVASVMWLAEGGRSLLIHQDVSYVNHRDIVDDLVRVGREVERRVLARAVRWHLQDRVLVDENRTVIFE